MTTRKDVMRGVGTFCKEFRIEVLKMTLENVSRGTNIKTLSGFEHGRSSNILHVLKYIEACEDRTTRNLFLKGLCEVLEGEINE